MKSVSWGEAFHSQFLKGMATLTLAKAREDEGGSKGDQFSPGCRLGLKEERGWWGEEGPANVRKFCLHVVIQQIYSEHPLWVRCYSRPGRHSCEQSKNPFPTVKILGMGRSLTMKSNI